MKNPSYDQIIHSSDYRLEAALSQDDIKGFIREEFSGNRGWGRIITWYQILGILFLLIGLFKALLSLFILHNFRYLVCLGVGLIFTFTLLIVLHELIHALAYRCVGARHLSFGMDLKKFVFHVQAEKQVLNYRQFACVALAPAVLVGLFSLTGMVVFYYHPLFCFFLPVFSIHSLFCSGDFGLLCFYQNRPGMDIYTVDVKADRKTYFYSLNTGPAYTS